MRPLARSVPVEGAGGPPPPGVLLVSSAFGSRRGITSVSQVLARKLREAGWPVHVTSTSSSRSWRLFDMLKTAWLKRASYEVAHIDVFSGPAFRWAELLSSVVRSLGKGRVLTLRGGGLPAFARKHPDRVRRLLGSAEVVTVPSGFLAHELSAYRRDFQVLCNPLEVGAYPFRLRRHPSPRLAWLRSFHRIYNPLLAVHVLEDVLAVAPDATLTMFGGDKQDGSLELVREAAGRPEARGRVALPGALRKDEIPSRLDGHDIFLNTTDVDNTPVTVLEAMACGMIVISTDAGGMPYLIEHEQDGLLVPRGDRTAMAAAISRVLADPDLAERLSLNARRKVERFDWSVVLPQWEQILRSVAARGGESRRAGR